MSEQKIELATTMFKLLGHPLRLRIVELLDLTGEKTVNNICQETMESQPTVSLYLNKLKTSKLLQSRREGNQTYYFIAEPKLRILLDCLRECPIDGVDEEIPVASHSVRDIVKARPRTA